MDQDEMDRILEEDRKRLEEERKRLIRDERIRTFVIVITTLILISSLILVTFKFIIPFIKQKMIDNAAAEAARIALEEENARLAQEAEDARLILEAEAARIAHELELEQAALEKKMRRIALEKICIPFFDKGTDGYQKYIFDTREAAEAWFDKETSIKSDKTKSYDERVPFQLRYVFLNAKLGSAQSVPIAIAIGEIDSNNFNESTGLLCTNEGLISITGDGKDNLIYQTVMRREWV